MPHAGQELHGRCSRSGAVRRRVVEQPVLARVASSGHGTGVGVGVVVAEFFVAGRVGIRVSLLGG